MGGGASTKQKYQASSSDGSKTDAKSELSSPSTVSTPRSPKKLHARLRGHKLKIVAPRHEHAEHGGCKVIKWEKRIDKLYSFGAEVMPSTNYGTIVVHAVRLKDKKAVVVKIRDKVKAFREPNYETEWRHTTETLLNLPRHEHITEIFEVLEDEEAYYVVMERAEGMDLFETLLNPQRPSRSEIQAILRKLLTAIASLHAKGYIHRDLKLENVVVDKTPKGSSAEVGGFGPTLTVKSVKSCISESSLSTCDVTCDPTVKLIDFDTLEEFSPKTPKTPKLVLGTDMYIPVEAYSGHYSPASDIFSIGVIAYKSLTGRYPFSDSCFPSDKGDNYVGSPTMILTQSNLKNFVVNWTLPPFDVDADGVDLFRSMLDSDDTNRPTASQALEHRWFATTFLS